MTVTIPVIILLHKEMFQMSTKSHSITLRLSQEEYSTLSVKSKQLNMTQSQYIRSLINSAPVQVNNHKAEIWKMVIRIYNNACVKGILDSEIKKEMNQLCRTFLS